MDPGFFLVITTWHFRSAAVYLTNGGLYAVQPFVLVNSIPLWTLEEWTKGPIVIVGAQSRNLIQALGSP